MAQASISSERAGEIILTKHLDLCLKAITSFELATKVDSSAAEQAEVLLSLEAARLYTWGVALGIVNEDEDPVPVPEITSFYRQQSISAVLKSLHALLTDANLLKKAYGCLPGLRTETDVAGGSTRPQTKTAAARFAAVFENFTTSTSGKIKRPVKIWKISEEQKFNLFVVEVRVLVSQLHGMTENVLPRSVRNAMIYIRMWEIKYSWVATVIADACEDVFAEFALYARDLAEVLDMEIEDVGDNVRNFIGYWDRNARWSASRLDSDDDGDDEKRDIRFKLVESRLAALEARAAAPVPNRKPGSTDKPVTKSAEVTHPVPENGAPWFNPRIPPLQDLPLHHPGLHPGRLPVPNGPPHEELAGDPRPNSDPFQPEIDSFAPPSPSVWVTDKRLKPNSVKSAPKNRLPRPEEVYTPSNSSTGRDAGREGFWDDLNSDSDASENIVATSVTRSGAASKPSAEKHGPPTHQATMGDIWQHRRMPEHMAQLDDTKGAMEAETRDVDWEKVKQEGKKGSKVKSDGVHKPVAEDVWGFGNAAAKAENHHRHCGNCGEAMDEYGRRL